MASRTEGAVVNLAALVQGIDLVTFPAASTIFTDKSGYGLSSVRYGDMFLPQVVTAIAQELTAVSAAAAGGVIAFYQLGYGIAAFGVGPLQHAELSLSAISGGTAIVAAALAVLSFVVSPVRPGLRLGLATTHVRFRSPEPQGRKPR